LFVAIPKTGLKQGSGGNVDQNQGSSRRRENHSAVGEEDT